MIVKTDLWEFLYPSKKINKPIRLIELFAGIGSQFKALKVLGTKGKNIALKRKEVEKKGR